MIGQLCGVLAIGLIASPLWGADVLRYGRVQFLLPEGCQHQPAVDIDATDGDGGCETEPGMSSESARASGGEHLIYHLGSLICDGGRLKIRYDIGGNAGDYCSDHEPVDFRFRENGPLVRLCRRILDPWHRQTRKPVLALVVPAGSANFWSDHVDAAHVVTFLSLGRSVEMREQ